MQMRGYLAGDTAERASPAATLPSPYVRVLRGAAAAASSERRAAVIRGRTMLPARCYAAAGTLRPAAESSEMGLACGALPPQISPSRRLPEPGRAKKTGRFRRVRVPPRPSPSLSPPCLPRITPAITPVCANIQVPGRIPQAILKTTRSTQSLFRRHVFSKSYFHYTSQIKLVVSGQK